MIDMNQEKLSPEDEDRSAREREGAAAAALIHRLTQPKEDAVFIWFMIKMPKTATGESVTVTS